MSADAVAEEAAVKDLPGLFKSELSLTKVPKPKAKMSEEGLSNSVDIPPARKSPIKADGLMTY